MQKRNKKIKILKKFNLKDIDSLNSESLEMKNKITK